MSRYRYFVLTDRVVHDAFDANGTSSELSLASLDDLTAEEAHAVQAELNERLEQANHPGVVVERDEGDSKSLFRRAQAEDAQKAALAAENPECCVEYQLALQAVQIADLLRAARPEAQPAAQPAESKVSGDGEETEPYSLKPKWDRDRRELWYDETLCKKYRQKAENQVAILEAFEEEGWRTKIDDPLPPKRNSDHHQRLSDTIKRLNQNKGGLTFERDGTGEGLLWYPTEDLG